MHQLLFLFKHALLCCIATFIFAPVIAKGAPGNTTTYNGYIKAAQDTIQSYANGLRFFKKEDFRVARDLMDKGMGHVLLSDTEYSTLYAQQLFLQAASLTDMFSDSIINRASYLYCLSLLDTAITILPEAPYLYQMRAELLCKIGKTKGAIKELKRANKLSTKTLYTKYYLGVMYYANKRYRKSLYYHKLVLKYDSNFAHLHCDACSFMGMGNAYSKIKQTGRALYYYKKAIALYPAANDGYSAATELLCKKKKQQEAKALAHQLLLHDSLSGYFYLAMIERNFKNYNKAEKYAELALQKDGISAACYALLGLVQFDKREPENAIQYYKSALQLNADNEEVIEYLVNAYYQTAGYDSIVPELTRLLPRMTKATSLSSAIYFLIEYYGWRYGKSGKHLTTAEKQHLINATAPLLTRMLEISDYTAIEIKKPLYGMANESAIKTILNNKAYR